MLTQHSIQKNSSTTPHPIIRLAYRRDNVFDFNEVLKKYIRSVAVDDLVDAPPPIRAIAVSSKDFVTLVVRHLDEALQIMTRFIIIYNGIRN